MQHHSGDEHGLILDWEDAARAGVALCGGKGSHLARLRRCGFPVADGCVLTVRAYRQAIGDALHPAALDACALAAEHGAAALAAVREAVMRQPLPRALAAGLDRLVADKGWHATPLAVRSSAPSEDSAQASFAGIHDSVLNVRGREALEQAIRTVWASLWTPRAAAYRERMGVAHRDAAMAVVIMPLIEARASGIVFTCDPASGREDHCVVSAVRGLGQPLVSGEVPGEDITLERDRYPLRWRVAARRPSTADTALQAGPDGGMTLRRLTPSERGSAVLDDAQAQRLAAIAWDAAQALDFGAPWFDIEWCWDGAQFHLVQARPMTRKPWYTYPELRGQSPIWSNGNTRDVLPFVLDPVDLQNLQCEGNALLETPGRVAGHRLLPGAQRVALFGGRAYLNMSFIQWEAYAAFGLAPQAMNRMIGGHQPAIPVPPPTWRLRLRQTLHKLRFIVRIGRLKRAGLRDSRRIFEQRRDWQRIDLRALGDADLLGLGPSSTLYERHQGLALMQCFSSGAMELLERLEKLFPGEGDALLAALLAGGEPSVSARQGYELIKLADLARDEPGALQALAEGRLAGDAAAPGTFARAVEDFLEEFGHRGVYESHMRSPRLREIPAFLAESIAGLQGASLAAIRERQRQTAARAWARLAQRTGRIERLMLKGLLRMAKTESNHRELARSTFMVLAGQARSLMLETARRLVERGVLQQPDDVFRLLPDEQARALRGELAADAVRARIALRAEQARVWETLVPPDLITAEGPAAVATAAVATAAALPPVAPGRAAPEWRGTAIGGGYVEGRVRIVRDPRGQAVLQPGDILVAPSTDPSWVPLFLKAGGLIMETGGFLSHGAIVAREFGIPAVVNLPGVLDRLHDGERVAVDGGSGTIRCLDRG